MKSVNKQKVVTNMYREDPVCSDLIPLPMSLSWLSVINIILLAFHLYLIVTVEIQTGREKERKKERVRHANRSLVGTEQRMLPISTANVVATL